MKRNADITPDRRVSSISTPEENGDTPSDAFRAPTRTGPRGRNGLRAAVALALVSGSVALPQASGLTLTINGQPTLPDPSSGTISVFTQQNPVRITSGPFGEGATEASLGVIGTFSAGSRRRTGMIFLVRLPEVVSSADIVSATATIDLVSKADSPNWSLDLYGIGFVPVGVIDPDWRLFGDVDPAAGVNIPTRPKIQDNMVTPSTPIPSSVSTDAGGEASLVNFIRSLYDAGATPGDLAVFRVNPDVFLVPESGGTPQYRLRIDLADPVDECGGMEPTITGTAGNDVLEGTPGDDVIHGGDGHDIIRGKAGNDVICGGPGNDLLIGGNGDDTLRGGSGKDVLRGAAGTDNLRGGGGGDVLHGGSGADQLQGKGGDDRLFGDAGNDDLDGGTGDDIIVGGANDDAISGGDGFDLCDDAADDIVGGCELTR